MIVLDDEPIVVAICGYILVIRDCASGTRSINWNALSCELSEPNGQSSSTDYCRDIAESSLTKA